MRNPTSRSNRFVRVLQVRMCLALIVLSVSAATSPVLAQAPSGTAPDTNAGAAPSPGTQPPTTETLLASAGTGDVKESENAETQPAPEVSSLGATAGGAAGTGAALPTLQGDTTWGGRPAFPQVIAPAFVATPGGLPILNDSRDQLVFNGTVGGNLTVPGNSLPASLKSADLVVGFLGFQIPNTNTYLPFDALLLSSPIIGYDMINWAENGSILPQDRVFFDYRHFDAVGSVELVSLIYETNPQTGHTGYNYRQEEYFPLSVDRYCLGFEKTFGGGLWSIEARFPFQGQATATQTFGAYESLQNSLSVGNIGLALKRYLVQGDRWNVTGGLGLQLPTAPATNLTFAAHQYREFVDTAGTVIETFDLYYTENVRQSNETAWLNPFVGASYDAHNRLFAQGMFQLCVPLNPSSATLTTTIPKGTIVDRGATKYDFSQTPLNTTTNIAMAFETLFRTNASVGCWLYQDPNRKLSSIAAMLEVDDTNALGNRFTSNVVDLGPQLTANVGNTEICAGMLVPVTGDEAYKSEFIFRLNRKF